jgi:uncharacterized protein (TIGR02271 family)
MLTTHDITSLRGCDVLDRDGDKIGKLDEVYLDNDTGEPEFGLVSGGLFGGSHFVPLAEAHSEGGTLRVPYEKSQVKDAPGVRADEQLSQDEEQRLYRHYGLAYGERRSESGLPEGRRGDDIVSAAGTGTTTGRTETGRGARGDEAMTRSEEEMRVGTQSREAGRARLRKWVSSETVSETVPVQREQARVEREPITDTNRDAALRGPDISEAEHEVTLMEEQPVVEKRTVPRERVRLDKEAVTDEQEVTGEVRKEHIEVEGDADRRR